MKESKKVGEVIRIIWDQETGSVQVVLEITDPKFKSRVLHSKDFQDILSINGRDAMVIATTNKNSE